MLDSPPAEVLQCQDIADRLNQDELMITLYKAKEDQNRTVRQEYYDLLKQYSIMLYLYEDLKQRYEPKRPQI